MKTITIKQPWASMIVEGIKDIENRTWKCPQKHIGHRVLIHASAKPVAGFPCEALTPIQYATVFNAGKLDALNGPCGAIIGSVEIEDCVQNALSIWAEKGLWHWKLRNPILFDKPIPCKGRLSFWDYDVEFPTVK